jgi:hypothetical protein
VAQRAIGVAALHDQVVEGPPRIEHGAQCVWPGSVSNAALSPLT